MGWDADSYLRHAIKNASHGYALVTDSPWLNARPEGVRLPDQGWKLHVSSTAAGFPAAVTRVLPLIISEGCHFKLAQSDADLARLNQGALSPAVVGKAITIYPDPGRFRDLGLVLAELLAGHEGPRILSDRRVAEGSPVYYRYGPFAATWHAGDRGTLGIKLRGPESQWFDGAATLEYRQPSWVSDPFGRAPDSSPEILGGRYRVTLGIHRAPQGDVFRAHEVATGREVIIKQARAHVDEGLHGTDARSRLRNERRVLARLSGIDGVPVFIDHFAHGDDEFLVASDAGPVDLSDEVRDRGAYLLRGERERPDDFALLAAELAHTVLALHDAGVIMRDITPKNVILGAGRAFLIDFGISAMDGFHLPGGTDGFAPLRQLRGEPPRATDDIYGLGMTLAFAATGMMPVLGIRTPGLGVRRLMRSMELIYGTDRGGFVSIVRDLISEDETVAIPAMHRLASGRLSTGRKTFCASASSRPDSAALEEHLLHLVQEQVEEHVLGSRDGSFGSVDATVYTGSAGVGLELLHHRERPGVAGMLERLADHCAAATGRAVLNEGLFSGTTGIELFLARMRSAGLGTPEINRESLKTVDTGGTDIISGTAGIALGRLLLGDVEAARSLGRQLPNEHDPTETAHNGVDLGFGYAHGLAGDADVLLRLATRTADRALSHRARGQVDELVKQTADRIAAAAIPMSASWCRGLAGAARTMLRASDVLDEPGYGHAAEEAALTCAEWIPRIENLGQCCGVSGVGTLMIDFAVHTGDERFWEAAYLVADQLIARSSDPDAHPRFILPERQYAPHSWAMGNTGILAFIRRLNRPSTPDMLAS